MRSLYLPMVASKLADPEAVAAAGLGELPPGLMLSQHQLDTTLALQKGTVPIIFNTAMTGDGKSLASQLRFWKRRKPEETVLTMYPTNELIHDQFNAIQRNEAQWGQKVLKKALNSRILDEAALDENRGAALLRILLNNDLILTNPDIIHYVMQLYYRRGHENPDLILGRFADLFVQWTFDEFHVLETPQVTAVMNALLLLQERGGPRHFLFLSATPDDQFLEYLHRSELASVEIKGTYTYGSVPDHGWRPILQATTLHIGSGKAEEWVPAHLTDLILPFFNDRKPGAKGAIIVNSVATALRLTQALTKTFRELGVELTVAANTGLTGAEGRRRSYDADLLIATSTVDVGVDFQINFLIFESLNSGTFLQRLGRLGRHASFTRADGVVVPFQEFVAYALVPEFVYERLFEGKQGQPESPGIARCHYGCLSPTKHLSALRTGMGVVADSSGVQRIIEGTHSGYMERIGIPLCQSYCQSTGQISMGAGMERCRSKISSLA
jgi:CRISPR-associated endonuclease/helicase Cas3